MSLVSIRDIKNLLKRHEVHLLKRLGQIFLIDEGVIKKIIESAQLSKNDIILEIGPGIGVLTMKLAKKAKKVIAIEKDPKMIEILKELLECWNVRNVEIVKGDILKLDPKPYTLKPYKVVANLPFYLTVPVIRQFLEAVETKPQQMVLVVQKEVGQRICARPPEMSILAVSVQFYVYPVKSREAGAAKPQFNGAGPEIITFVSKKSFWPQPKVDGAIIKIISKKLSTRPGDVDLFFKIVRAGFSHPRKQLINNLSRGLKLERNEAESWLLKNNIRPSQRAETLSVEDWINLLQSCRIN